MVPWKVIFGPKDHNYYLCRICSFVFESCSGLLVVARWSLDSAVHLEYFFCS